MNWKKDFLWPFSGLKIGVHESEFVLEADFFQELHEFNVLSGNGLVKAQLEKKETMLMLSLYLEARIQVNCDRCNEEMEIPISGTMELIYKFGAESSADETLIVLPQDAHQLDAFQPCFELVVVSLPSRFVHEEEDCNQEIIKLLKSVEPNTSDPRWEKLKKIN